MKWKIAPPRSESNSRPLDYIPKALTDGLRECETFQLMVSDTGSGDIDILCVKDSIRNANVRGQQHPFGLNIFLLTIGEQSCDYINSISTVNSCS